MARRAVGEFLHFVIVHKLAAQGQLIAGRPIKSVENFRPRPQIVLRRVLTIVTPAHIEALAPPGNVHLSDRAVTRRAADALGDVYTVIEVDEIRLSVDARPGDGFRVGVT